MPKLTFENGPRDGTEFTFDQDIVIGRSDQYQPHLSEIVARLRAA